MKKYWYILQIAWSNGLVYRTSLLIWRFRQMLSTVMALTVWTVIFTDQQTAFGYTQSGMTSYVFLVSFLQSLILASSLHNLSGEIYSGSLSKDLLRPLNIFASLASLEVADKLRNVAFSVVEASLLWLVFQPVIIFPSLGTLAVFLLWSLASTVLNFFITIIFGTLGFRSPETWGPKFLFFMILDFTAGKLFPLDILPQNIQKLIFLTPFPYLSYAQIQLFLGRFTSAEVWQHTLGLGFWLLASWGIMMLLWRKGLSSYEAAGM